MKTFDRLRSPDQLHFRNSLTLGPSSLHWNMPHCAPGRKSNSKNKLLTAANLGLKHVMLAAVKATDLQKNQEENPLQSKNPDLT